MIRLSAFFCAVRAVNRLKKVLRELSTFIVKILTAQTVETNHKHSTRKFTVHSRGEVRGSKFVLG